MMRWSLCLTLVCAISPACGHVSQRFVTSDVSALSDRFDELVRTYNNCTSANVDSSLDNQLQAYLASFSKLSGTIAEIYLRGEHQSLRDSFAVYEAYTEPFVAQSTLLVEQLLAESSVTRRRVQLSELGELLRDQRTHHNTFVDVVNEFERRRF